MWFLSFFPLAWLIHLQMLICLVVMRTCLLSMVSYELEIYYSGVCSRNKSNGFLFDHPKTSVYHFLLLEVEASGLSEVLKAVKRLHIAWISTSRI